jgi:hypothetical protein
MMPIEFADLVASVQAQFGVHLILVRSGKGTATVADVRADLAASDSNPRDLLFFASSQPREDQLVPDAMRPAEFGWVLCRIPRVEARTLYLADVSIKTMPTHPMVPRADIDRDPVRFYNRLVGRFRKELHHAVWLENARGESGPARGVKCTDGVTSWFRSGGKLAQYGVANTRFFLPGDGGNGLATP